MHKLDWYPRTEGDENIHLSYMDPYHMMEENILTLDNCDSNGICVPHRRFDY